jgi:hypothetical protein
VLHSDPISNPFERGVSLCGSGGELRETRKKTKPDRQNRNRNFDVGTLA